MRLPKFALLPLTFCLCGAAEDQYRVSEVRMGGISTVYVSGMIYCHDFPGGSDVDAVKRKTREGRKSYKKALVADDIEMEKIPEGTFADSKTSRVPRDSEAFRAAEGECRLLLSTRQAQKQP